MFFRVKNAGSYQYLQIVHSVRQGENVRQQVLGTLGRLYELKASGRLEALIRSGLESLRKVSRYRCAYRWRDSGCHGAADRAGLGLWTALERTRYSGGTSITAQGSPLRLWR
jgi:hypothetical protein